MADGDASRIAKHSGLCGGRPNAAREIVGEYPLARLADVPGAVLG